MGRVLVTFCFPLKNIKEKSTLIGSEVSKLHYDNESLAQFLFPFGLLQAG